jgi:hypothetical protein
MSDKPNTFLVQLAEAGNALKTVKAADAERIAILSPQLIELAATVRTIHVEITDMFAQGVERAIIAGKALVAAKKLCRHGEWEFFVINECGFRTTRTAARYMQLARWEPKLRQMLEAKKDSMSVSQSGALKLLTDAKRKRKRKPSAK